MSKFVIQKNKNFTRKSTTQGFTLVEVLVAIALFSLAVLSMMVILGGSLSNINYVKKKTTATYLAQEGIEYIRNLRDTFVLFAGSSEDGWVSFLDYTKDCSGTANSKLCYFDPTDIDFSNDFKPITEMDIGICPGNSCPILYYNPDNLVYDYDVAQGSPSGFSRGIRIERINSDEVAVESYVFWNQGSGVHQISFRDHLFNWTKQ